MICIYVTQIRAVQFVVHDAIVKMFVLVVAHEASLFFPVTSKKYDQLIVWMHVILEPFETCTNIFQSCHVVVEPQKWSGYEAVLFFKNLFHGLCICLAAFQLGPLGGGVFGILVLVDCHDHHVLFLHTIHVAHIVVSAGCFFVPASNTSGAYIVGFGFCARMNMVLVISAVDSNSENDERDGDHRNINSNQCWRCFRR